MSAEPRAFKLERAVFYRGRFIRQFSMRAPTPADFQLSRELCEEDGQRGLFLVAHLCGIAPGAIRKLAESDMAHLGQMYDELTAE